VSFQLAFVAGISYYAYCKRSMKHLPKLAFTLLASAASVFAQTEKPSSGAVPEPHEVTYCELSKDPAAYNHELVRLTAFVTHGFENFHVADPTCVTEGFSVWVMYGGTATSDTVYCCPGEGGQERRETLTVEGLQVPLVEDLTFRQFTELLKNEEDTTVRVTLMGRFFSGVKNTVSGSTYWGGAGHLGCCSLLVVQRVEAFQPHTRRDLDYTSDGGWYEKEGCKFGSLQYQRHVSVAYPDGETEQAIAEQRNADGGQGWAFRDPQRVAMESLKPFYTGQVPNLRSVTKTPSRQVFQWKNGKKMVVVVVVRPYWLSFYAASDAVAWVSTTIKEADCQH
jgi:hypothetical protein